MSSATTDDADGAWGDYSGRILELEVHGYSRLGEEAVRYGRRWTCELRRGIERISVRIERTVAGSAAPTAISD